MIPAGQTSATISIVVFGDTADEPNESFTVTLSNANTTIGDGSAIGTILTLIAAVFLGIVGFVWYPVKRLLRRSRTSAAERAAPQVEAQAQSTET